MACDSAITAIWTSLSIRRFLTSCLFGYSPLTIICIRLISFISLSSLIQLSIFCCLLILFCRSCLECFCFHPRVSLECYVIQFLISFLPHYMLKSVANDSLAISSFVRPIQLIVSSIDLVPLLSSVACHVSLWFSRFCCLGIHLISNYFCHRLRVATIHRIRS